MKPYVEFPDDPYARDPIEPTDPTDPGAPFGPPPKRRGRNPFSDLLRDPRRRMLLVAAGALAVVLAVVVLWYGDPTNRARRELAHANERIVDKQREVADARRLLAERIAELRAARAEAEVQATRYQSAIDRSTRPPELDSALVDSVLVDSAVVGGEVVPPDARPRP